MRSRLPPVVGLRIKRKAVTGPIDTREEFYGAFDVAGARG
jgi:hypothetical protein